MPCLSVLDVRSMLASPTKTPANRHRTGNVRPGFCRIEGQKRSISGFQFDHGQPLPAIRKILVALPKTMTPWQIALWFASGNGWLGGVSPQDSLVNVDDVVAAASRLDNLVFG